LADAKTISEALRMISEEKTESEPATAPRSERKPATVVVSVPEIPDNTAAPDPDPTPSPPTIRKTAAGSQKVSEAKQPRTQQVPVEIVPDEPEPRDDAEIVSEWLVTTGFIDIVNEDLEMKPDFQPKSAAKVLRKLADKLDPPTKFVKPDGNDVCGFLRELASTDAFIREHGSCTDLQVLAAADEFIDHYESNGWMVGRVSMKDWRATARKWLKNQGRFSNGGHNSGAAHRGTGKRGYTADEVFS
jgi:hypothetical protein